MSTSDGGRCGNPIENCVLSGTEGGIKSGGMSGLDSKLVHPDTVRLEKKKGRNSIGITTYTNIHPKIRNMTRQKNKVRKKIFLTVKIRKR